MKRNKEIDILSIADVSIIHVKSVMLAKHQGKHLSAAELQEVLTITVFID